MAILQILDVQLGFMELPDTIVACLNAQALQGYDLFSAVSCAVHFSGNKPRAL